MLVNGSVQTGGTGGIITNSLTYTTQGSLGVTGIASWYSDAYRSYDFNIQASVGTTGPYQYTKIMAIHNIPNGSLTNGSISTLVHQNITTGGKTAATYTVDVSGTLIRLRVTPGFTAATVYKVGVTLVPKY